ncbi:MAG: FeoA family protein [Clostridia bacterium]|nr:FeoA family protein [Clostridia bacterium]
METLRELSIGGDAIIVKVCAKGGLFSRLSELGMTKGSPVCCLFCAPGGNPRAYLVCGAVIAIRNADAEKVWIETK